MEEYKSGKYPPFPLFPFFLCLSGVWGANGSPTCRMSFAIAGTEYVVLNDGCVVIAPSRKNQTMTGRSIPISFEVRSNGKCVYGRRDSII